MNKQQFEKSVQNTIKKYNLLSKSDKVMVAVSGGKDSMTVMYLLKKLGYNVSALHINLEMSEWSQRHLDNIKKFCKSLEVPLHVYSVRNELGRSMCSIKSIVKSNTKLQDCTICGILRRWMINKKARELKATKIATGHNLDDASQTVLMNYFKGNIFIGVNEGPKVGIIEDPKFIQRIKPLYFMEEKNVEAYSKSMNFPVVYERCPCVVGAYRHNIRNTLNNLEKKNKKIKANIVKAYFSILPGLRKRINPNNLRYCSSCGEPSRNEICKSCLILQNIK